MIEVDIISKVVAKGTGKGVSMFGGGDSIDLSAYATLEYVLGNFVTLDTEQTILGKKNFTGGLLVNGSPIYYDAENKYWKLEGDLLVTGGVTMYADEGTYTPSTIMDALLLDPDTLEINSEGKLTVIGGTSSGGAVSGDYLPLTGGTLTGKLTISNDADGLVIARTSTSVPSIAFNNSSGWQGSFGFSGGHPKVVIPSASTSWTTILHSGNYSSYALPLSGGTINGTLTVDTALNYPFTIRRSNTNASYVAFENANGYLGDIGFLGDGTLYVYTNGVNNTLWHSGNDGAGSGLEADYIGVYGNNSDDKVIISGSRTDNTWPRRLVDNGYGLVVERTTNNGLIRNYIATLSDNVASATKLQTARTIWGQSFDGSGNVNGNLQFKGNYTIQNSLGNNVFHAYNAFTIVGYDNCPNQKSTYIDGYAIYLRYGSSWTEGFVLNSVGDVGIGTTSPLYKVDIRGPMMCQLMRFYSYSDSSKEVGYIGRGSSSSNNLIFYAAGGSLRFYANDNTSVGMIFENQNLTVAGGITMYSDQRKKTILNHVELSLKQIADAPLIEHFYNSDEQKTTHVGSIAQYWAGINDWFCKLDGEGYYTMEIQNAALASAISIARELTRYESKTDKKIRKMQQRIIELEDELEKLKRA